MIIIVVIVGGIIGIIKILNSPAVGTVIPTATQPSSTTVAPNKPGNYFDKYISFTYPGNLEVIPSQKGTGYLDVVNLYSNNTDHNNEHLAVAVVHGAIANDSGISYRRAHTELYKEQPGSSGTIIFTKTDNGNEKTAFMTHGDLLASVSLTVPGSKDLSSDFATILNSFLWK
jgi:hypothetical protein